MKTGVFVGLFWWTVLASRAVRFLAVGSQGLLAISASVGLANYS